MGWSSTSSPSVAYVAARAAERQLGKTRSLRLRENMESENYKRFASLTFNDFRRMAEDESLSIYEKIGFPNSYREGKEELIFNDIEAKLPSLSGRDKIVLDIGPGCSRLPLMLIERCRAQSHTLLLVDS